MPTYVFTSPEGKEYEVVGPEGSTREQAFERLKASLGQTQKPQTAQPERLTIPKGPMQTGQIVSRPDLQQPIESQLPRPLELGSVMEPAVTIGTGMVAEPLAGLAGVATLPIRGPEAAAEAVRGTREALTVQPFSPSGERGLRAVGQAIEPIVRPFTQSEKYLGERGYELAGPVGGAIGEALPTAAISVAGPALSKVGTKLVQSGAKSLAKNKKKFVDDLILPEKTKKVLVEETARTTEKGIGPFKRSVVEPSAREAEIAVEVTKIPKVSPNKTIQGNLNEIRSYNKQLAIDLSKKLDDANVQIGRPVAKFDIDDAIDNLIATDPTLEGSQAMLKRLGESAKNIVDKHPPTAKGLWDARKEFDAFIKEKRANIFGTASEPPIKAGTYAIRDAMNNRIGTQVPKYKADLARQSALYDAIDNIAPKAATEANSAIARSLNQVGEVLGIRNKAIQAAAAALGIGGLGAAAQVAPWITVAGGTLAVGTGAAVGLTSPKLRMAIGQLIRASGQALGSVKDPSLARQIRADRAALISVLSDLRESESGE